MRKAGWFVCASLLTMAGARADPVHYFGNTLLIQRTTGQGRMLYRADHRFALVTIAGPTVQGTWEVRGSKLCLTPVKSAMAPFCVADDPVHRVGDHWAVMSPDGQHEDLTMIAGEHLR